MEAFNLFVRDVGTGDEKLYMIASFGKINFRSSYRKIKKKEGNKES